MEFDNRQHWLYFVDKLSIDQDLNQLVPEILTDLCQTFGFGCGFSYECDHDGVFRLTASHELYEGRHLSPAIPLAEALGETLYKKLLRCGDICFHNRDLLESPLEQALATLFSAQSMVLIPILDRENHMFCMVGLVDRRNKRTAEQSLMDTVHERRSRQRPEMDLLFCRATLTILSNYIKMQTFQKQAEDARASLAGILDNMGIDVYVSDFETHELLYLNHSMAATYGPAETLIGKPSFEAFPDRADAQCDYYARDRLLDDSGAPTKGCEEDQERDNGTWARVFHSAFRWLDGRMAQVVSSLDITESKRNEEIIRQMAEYDFLTGLPNRYALSQLIDDQMHPVDEEPLPFHLIFFDLDGFKAVNDTMGHKAGDELLKKIAAQLQKNPLTRHRAYRYGGDEFVVLVDQEQGEKLPDVIRFLQTLFSSPWELNDGVADVGASLGISAFPQDAAHTGDLIRKADQAMYASKRAGKGKAHFYNNGDFVLLDSYEIKKP